MDEQHEHPQPDTGVDHAWPSAGQSAPGWGAPPSTDHWASAPTASTPVADSWNPDASPASSGWAPPAPPAAPSNPWAQPTASWPASPPSAGGPTPPYGPPPVEQGFRYEAPRSNGSGKGGRTVGIAFVVLLLLAAAVAAGVAVGRNGDSGDTAGAPVTAVANTPVTTAVPPLKGDSAEPALDVAKVLGPAVVQIETGTGLGSGFVYDRSGLILTAGHVTDGAKTVTVRLADGTKTEGKVLGQDDSTDVAVVKIDPPADLTVATLATGVPTQVGETAIAIGSPFGLDQTVTAGIVSAVGRSVETPGGVIPAVQTDAPINSGNSGGALADRQGRVIGINDSIVTGSRGSAGTGNVGVGFAIPIDIAKSVADKIVAGDSTAAGFLGVEGADATGSRSGAALTTVADGSPAAKAGLTTDDVVVAVDGQKVSSMIDLAAAVRTHAPGDKVTLTVLRSGKERTVTVALGSAAENRTGG